MTTGPHVIIHTDGACKGNPGPGGWGVILRMGKHEKELSGGDPATTNNRMEMTAAIRALNALTESYTKALSDHLNRKTQISRPPRSSGRSNSRSARSVVSTSVGWCP